MTHSLNNITNDGRALLYQLYQIDLDKLKAAADRFTDYNGVEERKFESTDKNIKSSTTQDPSSYKRALKSTRERQLELLSTFVSNILNDPKGDASESIRDYLLNKLTTRLYKEKTHGKPGDAFRKGIDNGFTQVCNMKRISALMRKIAEKRYLSIEQKNAKWNAKIDEQIARLQESRQQLMESLERAKAPTFTRPTKRQKDEAQKFYDTATDKNPGLVSTELTEIRNMLEDFQNVFELNHQLPLSKIKKDEFDVICFPVSTYINWRYNKFWPIDTRPMEKLLNEQIGAGNLYQRMTPNGPELVPLYSKTHIDDITSEVGIIDQKIAQLEAKKR